MKQFLPILISCCLVVSCSNLRHRVKLSKFTFNDKKYNHLIVERKVDYGFNGKDGCVVEGQLFLSLSSKTESQVLGVVKDVKSLSPMSGSNVFIFFEGQNSPSTRVADEKGQFTFSLESEVNRIQVVHAGWRPLLVDFSREKIF